MIPNKMSLTAPTDHEVELRQMRMSPWEDRAMRQTYVISGIKTVVRKNIFEFRGQKGHAIPIELRGVLGVSPTDYQGVV